MATVYLVVLALLLILMFLAINETPVSDSPVSAALRPVRRTAVWLYRVIQRISRRLKPESQGFPGIERVRKDLSILDPSRKAGRRAVLYTIDKLQNLLLFLLAADLLALAVWYSSGQAQFLSEDGTVERPDYGEASLEVSLLAGAAQGEEEYGQYTVEISARQYTEDQAQEMAEELLEELPERILGENEGLDCVRSSLDLISEAEGYPFEISWQSSRYTLIDNDGTIDTDQIQSVSGEKVTLTARLSYLDWSWTENYEAVIYPMEEAEAVSLEQAIQEALDSSNEETAAEETYVLPDEAGGVRLSWTEDAEDSSLLLFGLIVAAGIAVFLSSDRDLHQKLESRERQMTLDYPQIISKLVLFLGAGMSVRNAFQRLGENYQEDLEKGGERHYVYEEILLVCREMDSGISESTAYANFGRRCRSRQYSKLSSLLAQNLKKGNSALLQALQEEADLAFEERKSLARRMGEEAGTRLLLPMIMMLAVTLVIIMIPAYLSFSL